MSRLRDPSGPPDQAAEQEPEVTLAEVARAADALRAGRFVRMADAEGGAIAVLAVETAGESALREFAIGSPPAFLILTHARARTLKIPLYTSQIVAVPLAPPIDREQLRTIADPTSDLGSPLKGPFEAVLASPSASCPAAVRLAKIAGLLPSVVIGPADLASHGPGIAARVVEMYDELILRTLSIVVRARVPLEDAENTEIVVFRAGSGDPEHYAIVLGNPPTNRPVLARLHSECFTGDLLASLRCDCGSQLRGAIRTIAREGGGVLIYLAQEGRGIGLVNKLRAYRLQDQGFDTLEANERLGFASDERLYAVAARMLELLGFDTIRLLTNNPHKVEALAAAGIRIMERVPHAFPANPHNVEYLRTKAAKSGHLLE